MRPDYNSSMSRLIRLKEVDREAAAEACARVLDDGGLAVIPTDTVYGVAARPDIPGAVEKVFRAKGRKTEKALVVMVADLEEAQELADPMEREGLRKLGRLWPGALTIVLNPAPRDWLETVAPLGTLGIRVPACPFLTRLLGLTGPLAVTSANLSGDRPPASYADINPAFMERLDYSLAVESEEAGCGRPSTVVELRQSRLKILRAGDIGESELRSAWNGVEIE